MVTGEASTTRCRCVMAIEGVSQEEAWRNLDLGADSAFGDPSAGTRTARGFLQTFRMVFLLWCSGRDCASISVRSQDTNGLRVGEPEVCHHRLGVCVGARHLLDGDSEGVLDHVDLSVAEDRDV